MSCKTFTRILLLAALETAPLSAATLTVDARGGTPYQTIQSAINAAIPGVDEVFVRCSVYHENVVMRDQVSVRGQRSDCTVIDGGASGSAVRMVQIGAATQLKDFTIRNGRAARGGGIYLEATAGTITGNVITANSAVGLGLNEGTGGGIHVTSPTGFVAATAPVITKNIIRGNYAEQYGGGIAIYSDEGSTISGNLIAENTAELAGGGVDMYQSFPTLINNTIVRNCLQGIGTACALGGGGISLANSGIVSIVNNLIAWNEAVNGAGGVDLVSSTATFTSNDSFGNVPANYAGIPNPTGSNGNISTDPLLVDERYGSFRGFQPRSHSPLIDAGSAPLAPPLDLGSIPRPLDGDANGTALPDIGARENEGITVLRFVSRTALNWDPSVAQLAFFNLYRGDLQTLRVTGIYMQDPATVTGARRQCNLGSALATDSDSPTAGQTFFYIAAVKNAVEGTLGFDSAGIVRPGVPANRCP